MADEVNNLNPEQKVKKLKEIVSKKDKELEEEKKKLSEAEKQEYEKKIFEAILKREKEITEKFKEEQDIKKKERKDNDLSSLLLEKETNLESKLKGVNINDKEASLYLSSKSAVEDLYNNVKSLYDSIENGTVTPEMAQMAGSIQYALEQKYQDVKSGNYSPEYNSSMQASVASKIADDILSIYTGTKTNSGLRKY
jgi:hypothetical protein